MEGALIVELKVEGATILSASVSGTSCESH